MTDINELQRFTGVGHDVVLSYFGYNYGDNVWGISITAHQDGVKLECKGTGDTPEAAFLEAAAKFDRVTNSGAKELNPALVYEPAVPTEYAEAEPFTKVAPDDEIPF